MSSTIEHDYAPICDLYERHLGPALFEPYAIDLAHRVAENCAEGSILEMACGTGIVTRQLRAHLKPTVALTATDINPGMLDYAQKKLNATERITWKQADIANLPFTDASFNVAVCQFGIMFVPDKDRAFREMRRVLAAGGLLAFSVWNRMENNPWGIIAHETVGGFFPDNPPQFFKAPCSFYDVDVLRSLLSASGLIVSRFTSFRKNAPAARLNHWRLGSSKARRSSPKFKNAAVHPARLSMQWRQPYPELAETTPTAQRCRQL